MVRTRKHDPSFRDPLAMHATFRWLRKHFPRPILRDLYKNMDFRVRIIAYLCFFACIVSLPLFLATYIYASKSLEATAMSDSVQFADLTAQRIDTLFREMDSLALHAIYNSSIVDIVKKASRSGPDTNYFASHPADARTILENLSRIAFDPPFDSRISLFNNRLDYISYGGLSDQSQSSQEFLQSVEFVSLYGRVLSLAGKRLILPIHGDFWSPHTHLKLVSILREIRDLHDSYGVIQVQLPFSLLEALCNVQHIQETRVFVLSKSGEVLYPGQENTPQPSAILRFYLARLGANPAEKTRTLSVVNPESHAGEIVTSVISDYSGVTVISVQSRAQILMPIRLLRNAWVVILLCVLALSALLMLFIASQLTKPLIALKDSVKSASIENPNITLVNENHNSVLAQLNEAFEEMFKRLRNSMDQVVMLRARELNAHVLALQSQMNPHFLYNSLAVIMSSAQDSGAEKTVEICHRLSKMLRYVISYESTESTVGGEIKYVANYLKLMKERYEDSFHFEIDVDRQMDEIIVPKLIVQPLAENCFRHGFRKTKPPWSIRVSGTRSNGGWRICVEDNGIGVEPGLGPALEEKAARMIADASLGTTQLGSGTLGLLSTLVRLKLRYPASYIFTVERRTPAGTAVTLGARLNDSSAAC